MIIFVDKNIFKHKEVQKPIIFPPNKTIFFGSKIAGKKIMEIKLFLRKKIMKIKNFLSY